MNDCRETIRKHDPDRFLLSLFAKPEKREALWALYAFNYEIAKTREVVTETQLGLIRLQWWRDALAGIYERNEVLKHQVVEPLAAAIKKYDLPRDLFDALIYAREFDLEDRLPANMEGLMHYADYTSTPLLELSRLVILSAAKNLSCLGTNEILRCAQNDSEENRIQKIAIAYALTGMLRALPFHLHQRRCYLPEDLLQQEGISIHDLYEGKNLEKLKPVVKRIVEKCGEGRGEGSDAEILKLTRRMTKMYINSIKAADYNVFTLRPPPFMALRLWLRR